MEQPKPMMVHKLFKILIIIIVAAGCGSAPTAHDDTQKPNEVVIKEIEGQIYSDSVVTVLVEEAMVIRKRPIKYYFVGKYYVIAPAGLNLRSEPNTKSKVIKTLPFGAQLEVVEDKSYGMEKLKEITFYNKKGAYKEVVNGHWVKVKYKGIIGFVHNSFIDEMTNGYNDFAYNVGMNEKMALLLPGGVCQSGLWFSNKANWVGCYREGNAYYLKKVTLGIYHTASTEDSSGHLIIGANDNKNLKFILGSDNFFHEEKIMGRYLGRGIPFNKRVFKYHINTEGVIDRKAFELLEEAKDIISFYDFKLLWKGDLDNDGKPDFIISTNNESETTRHYLYLSAQFGNNKRIRPVAVFAEGYCC